MSNEFKVYYTVSEAVAYLRRMGYRVELRDVKRYACNEEWVTKVWQVQNPNTGKWHDVNACYRDIRGFGTERAWQSHVSKMDMINYFNNKRDE